MPAVTINSLPVMEARLALPRVGPWSAEVVVDSATAAQVSEGSRQDLEIATLVFSGTVFRSQPYAQNVSLKIIGGAHGMPSLASPRFYQNAPVAAPLADVLADAGEALAGSSNSLGVALPFWVTMARPCGLGLTNLADKVGGGCVWRVLPNGTVFFGVDSFQESALTDFELTDYRPLDGFQAIASELPDVFPGETFNGRKVSAVEHVVSASGSRASIWFEDSV